MDKTLHNSICVCVSVHTRAQYSVMSDSLQLHGLLHQFPLCVGFCSQEYWNELPFPPPGDISDLRIIPRTLVSPSL